jgi:hypothetical protein
MMTLYAIPVALLATAVFLGPTAHAEMPAKTFQVKFTYNAQAPAEEIYSDLQRTARKACYAYGPNSLAMLHVNRACARRVVDAGVKQLGRTDIATLHNGGIQTAGR